MPYVTPDSAIRLFSDDFNRSLLGPDWLIQYGATGFLGSDTITAQVVLAASRLVCSNVGAGSSCNTAIIPLPSLSATRGRRQFARATLTAAVTVQGLCGPAAMYSGGPKLGSNGYCFAVDGATGRLQIRRATPPDYTQIGSNLDIAIGGAALQIEAYPGAASNLIRGYQSGVLVCEFDDSNALRPVFTGFPILYMPNVVNGHPYTWDDFSCGKITP